MQETLSPIYRLLFAAAAGPTGQPELWPPDVDFCHLLYCDRVYCCTPPAGGSEEPNITEPSGNTTGDTSWLEQEQTTVDVQSYFGCSSQQEKKLFINI